MDILSLDSVIELEGKHCGKTVRQVVEKNRGDIMKLIKKGVRFDEEVLCAAHITKKEGRHTIFNQVCEHAKQTKKYEKDTATMKQILKEINTIERMSDYDESADTNEYPNENETD